MNKRSIKEEFNSAENSNQYDHDLTKAPDHPDIKLRILNKMTSKAVRAALLLESGRGSESFGISSGAPSVDQSFKLPSMVASSRKASLEPLAEWEGYVDSVGPDKFKARLVDVRVPHAEEHVQAEFDCNELNAMDLAALRPGAVFRWVIGYERSESGTKRRVSQIVFRRLPAWSRAEIQGAVKHGIDLHNAIEFE